MLRRLYFVLPSVSSTARIVAELQQAGIEQRHLTVASRSPTSISIPGIRIKGADGDPGDRIEHSLWNLNLVLFAAAAVGLAVLATLQGLTPWLLLPLAVMVATFLGGLRFTYVPNTHLREFADALHHGELVLMVDVSSERVADIEDLVHRHHADAAIGGVGWSSDLLHV